MATTDEQPDGAVAARPGEAVIRTEELTKRYGERAAVHELSLTVRRNEVYGLLGPNGAGKTTTLRMLVGLIRPTSGSAEVLGAPPGSPEALRGIGALVEEPALYPYLSGRANLRAMAHYTGDPIARVDEALDRVGLLSRADDAVKTYSQGMRQRLGVAVALLKDPQVLILDEPTNGLDPQSMAQMRRLIRELGTDGRAVVLSSHLLHEVEQVCDRVGVIRDGELVAEDPVEQLRGTATLRVTAEPVDRAVGLLEGMPGVESVEVDGTRLIVSAPDVAPSDVNAALVADGVAVSHLSAEQRSLEDVFLALTGDQEVS
jgi:ABC-2 type transport system ATP-binding protein